MLSKAEVIRRINEQKAHILNLGIKRLGLFGSFVREQQNESSDIDILVEFEKEQKTFDHFMELIGFLENLLQRRVDLVTVESLSPYLGPAILTEVEFVSLAA